MSQSALITNPEWVSIGRASQMLGVSPATLRQWTSAGKVGAYRTPGGHRRYRAEELAATRTARETQPRGDLAAIVGAQLSMRYKSLGHSSSAHQGWLAQLDDVTRRELRVLGEELLARLCDLIEGPAHAPTGAARRIGAQYADIAARSGVELGQIVEAFLLFRRPLLDVLASSLGRYPEMGSELGQFLRRAERFMDDVLAAISSRRPAPAVEIAR